jgi:hypothetical protein
MARQKAPGKMIEQPITLPNGTRINITYDETKPPVIQWLGRYAVIACDEQSLPDFAVRTERPMGYPIPTPQEPDTPALAAARAIHEQRYPPAKPVVTADALAASVAQQNGLDPNTFTRMFTPEALGGGAGSFPAGAISNEDGNE